MDGMHAAASDAKAGVSDVAGPRFAVPLHVGRPNIPDIPHLLERFAAVLDSGWLTNMGQETLAFEQEFARLAGARHCIATANCTLALELLFRALDLKGEIIVPALTFVASAHSIMWHGCKPVFCDIAEGGCTTTADLVAPLMTDRTAAILGVHLWGDACDVDGLPALARTRRIPLLYDGAQAVGCGWRGRPLGGFGDATVFSFHATKIVNTFEGGAIVTDDVALAERLRLMRNFGFSRPDTVEIVGTNAKMSEISAAMGRVSLERLDDYVAINRRNHAAYASGLADLPGVTLREPSEGSESNFHYVVAEIDARLAGIRRDDLMNFLHDHNVRARRYFWPGCHRMEPYRSMPDHAGVSLPNTEALLERVLLLPTGTAVSPGDIATICDLVRGKIGAG